LGVYECKKAKPPLRRVRITIIRKAKIHIMKLLFIHYSHNKQSRPLTINLPIKQRNSWTAV